MSLAALREGLDLAALGREMHACVVDLYPLCRSLTGDGVRETLSRLSRVLPMERHEVASGTPVLDWTVPDEWSIRDAWVKDATGARVIDFQRSNLHVLQYSEPVHARMTLAELRPHLFTLPSQPDLVPYRTSYHQRRWGFCLSQHALDALPEGTYEVCIDSTLAPGHLTYGECVLPGRSSDEVLLSGHVCHPSLANDNLSAIVVAAFLGRLLRDVPRRHTVRLLFAPGTIGAITWLATHEDVLARIRAGLVLACLGDAGPPTYKRSRRGDATIDFAMARVLRARGLGERVRAFSPYGYDERQFGSPGFDLPVGRLTRTPHGEFPEYHTSADDCALVRPEALADSLALLLEVLEALESDRRFLNLQPKGEPQLGRRGLYRSIGGAVDAGAEEMAMLWVLNQSDGTRGVLEIAEHSGLAPEAIVRTAERTLRMPRACRHSRTCSNIKQAKT